MKRTEERIIRTYEQLLTEIPFHQITVRNIAESCGINHNTFYYYFRNINDLNRHLLALQLEKAKELAAQKTGRHAALELLVNDLVMHKNAILNLFHNMDLHVFMDTMEQTTNSLAAAYVENSEYTSRFPVTDRQTMVRFYKVFLFGLLMEWFRSEMDYDLVAHIHDIEALGKTFLSGAQHL